MSQKKPTLARGDAAASSGDGHEDLARPPPLQAVLLADSLTLKFRPITLERPKVLLPLVNKPIIEYTLRWLESEGVEETFFVCRAHYFQVMEYLNNSGWTGKRPGHGSMVVRIINASNFRYMLLKLYDRRMIQGNFVLISGSVVSNMSLKDALQEHMDRNKKEPRAVMTMVIKHSKPSVWTHQTGLGDDGTGDDRIVMVIHPETKQLLYYEETKELLYYKADKSKHLVIDPETKGLLYYKDRANKSHLYVTNDMETKGYKFYTHELRSGYAARIDNFSSYDTVSYDVISQRWTYPMAPYVPYVISSRDCSESRLRQGTYVAPDVTLSPSAQVVGHSVIGTATSIGDHCRVFNSVIGKGCHIGKYVWINDSFIWDNVKIEDGCKVSNSLVCDGVHLRAGAVVEPGCVLSFKVEVGKNVVVPVHSKVSLLPQPSNDIDFVITDDQGFFSMRSNVNQTTVTLEDESGTSETGTCGVAGYIWTSVDTGIGGECRQSVAPIPKGKLEEVCHAVSDDDGSEDESKNLPLPDKDDLSDNVVEDDDRISKFEKEVDEIFQQALDGGITQDNLILKISGLRLAYKLQRADCAGAVFYSIMKSALVAAPYTDGSLLLTTAKALDKWNYVLRNYTKTIDDEMEILLKFGVMCQETMKDFSPLFSEVLPYLYEMLLVNGGAILRWEEEKEHADKSYKFFVEQSEAFIQFLKEPFPEE